jgi:phage tail sheath protein FI
MASTLVSPGVLATETDMSQITQGPIQVGAAIVGPTVKGPVEIPTVVRSYSDYQNKFGTTLTSASQVYTYFTSIAAYNYFNNGGESLLVTRVVSGTYSPATSTTISNNTSTIGGIYSTGSGVIVAAFTDGQEARLTYNNTVYRFIASNNPIPGDTPPNVYFFSTGSSNAIAANNLKNKINDALSSSLASSSIDIIAAYTSSNTLILSGAFAGSTYNEITLSTGSTSTSFSTLITLGGGVDGSAGGTAFVLKTIAEGTDQNSSGSLLTGGILSSGSSDNIRWQITTVNSSSGTFTLLIRRGDDSTADPIVLEQFTNLSLDPFSANYITKVIGDQTQTLRNEDNDYYLQTSGSYAGGSRYVRVYSVTNTPNYLDTNGIFKPQYTASLPIAASGSFTGALGSVKAGAKFYDQIIDANTQGLEATNYSDVISLLANKDDYQYNVLLTPGLINNFSNHATRQTSIISNLTERGDAIYVMDLAEYGATVSTVTGQSRPLNTSYATTYWPWVQVVDPDSGQRVWVPASTVIGGVYAYNDSVSEPWFAPAGINRGGLGTVVQAERKLPQSTRDTLYEAKVNPIATFPGQGVVVYGQKTLQTKPSALDRVNVRRLLIALKGYISQVANTLVFEQNSTATRNNFLAQVNPYLESVQQRQGLYAFKVIMDDSNNTADVIDRNQLVGQIYVQPTKTAEFVYLDFIVTPTGATFPG